MTWASLPTIPDGAVRIGDSLYVFPDPELALRCLNDGADPQLYGGRCIHYGRPLAPRSRPERLRCRLQRAAEGLQALRRYRLRHPFRLIAGPVAVGAMGFGLLIRHWGLVVEGLVLLGVVGMHCRLTRREG